MRPCESGTVKSPRSLETWSLTHMTSGRSHKRVQEDVQPHQAPLFPSFQRNKLTLDTEPRHRAYTVSFLSHC